MADQVAAVRILFDFGRQLLQRATVRLLAEAADALPVSTAFDDLFADVRVGCRGEAGESQQRERKRRDAEAPSARHAMPPGSVRSPLREGDSHR
jgi:hypothetical protein